MIIDFLMIINLLKLLRAKFVQLLCFVLFEKVELHISYFLKKWRCATVTLRGNEKM